MKFVSPIDPHVHLRGEEYDIPYAKYAFDDARACGLRALYEMPNPKPWLTDENTVKDRLRAIGHDITHDKNCPAMADAKDGFDDIRNCTCPKVYHGVNIGLTNDRNQVLHALTLIMKRRFGDSVVADKTFYTHSTGNMGILDEDYQVEVWRTKAIGYRGISMGHFEDEKCYIGKFDPANPQSHSEHQNHVAEIVQVERQFRNAVDAKFEGTFYVCHISNPDTIDWLEKRMNKVKFRVVREVTFHHMFLNYDDYKIHGNRVKMNPPLRDQKMQEQLLGRVVSGKVEVIGTDHAPHPLFRKDDPKSPMSGVPAIPFWPKGIELLRKFGIKENVLRDVTFGYINNLFKLNLRPVEVDVEYQPSLWDKYGYNPFSRIE
jgi:dihydroorotase-like cyclic amidohydrolase